MHDKPAPDPGDPEPAAMVNEPAAAVTETDAEPAPPAAPKRSWRGPAGMAAALVLSFAWGALTYRELGTGPRVIAAPAVAAVAGSEAPPMWVGDFVQAFCEGDAAMIAERIGPPLDGQTAQIQEALESRQWTCADYRYLGGGTNTTGDFYAYVTIEESGAEQWWVFTVADERVVAIE